MCLYNPHWIPSIPSSQVPTLRLVLSTPLGCCNLPLLPSLSAANRSHRWQLSCRPPWRASEVVEVATWKPVYLKKTQAWGGFWHFKKKWRYLFFGVAGSMLPKCFWKGILAWKIWCKCVKSSMDSHVSHAPKTSCFGFLVGHPCFLVLKGKNTPRRFGKKSLEFKTAGKIAEGSNESQVPHMSRPHCTPTKTTMAKSKNHLTFSRRYISKWLVLHCHVSFSGCFSHPSYLTGQLPFRATSSKQTRLTRRRDILLGCDNVRQLLKHTATSEMIEHHSS